MRDTLIIECGTRDAEGVPPHLPLKNAYAVLRRHGTLCHCIPATMEG